jgi:hypothetical protein
VTPQTTTGWILFAAMWFAGPIAGYAASDLLAAVSAREPINRQDVLAAVIGGAMLMVATLLLIFVGDQ